MVQNLATVFVFVACIFGGDIEVDFLYDQCIQNDTVDT